MKTKLRGLLQLFGVDKLLVRLLERLVSGLNKKLETIKRFFLIFSTDTSTATAK
jgi:hypothetical protein